VEGVAADGGENVEYVDTSAYESYEKQEGDFVDPATLEQPFDPALDPNAVAPGVEPGEEKGS
jgi:hypothetical protein